MILQSPINLFFLGLKNQDLDALGALLDALGTSVEPPLPVMRGIAGLRKKPPASPVESPYEPGNILAERLLRRYLRIRAVQDTLTALDFKKAGPRAGLDDFVFSQIDFSVYKKIPEDDFAPFSRPGLDDFEDSFFKPFSLDREAAASMIGWAYQKTGGFFEIREDRLLGHPLLMSLMRSLQTSTAFVPLLSREELFTECVHLARGFGPVFTLFLRALDGAMVEHPDGASTDLSVRTDKGLTLRGTFHPRGKAYTITLASA
jgi:hypothetical protein